MKLFQIRHKPSGLFYKPGKINVSLVGKVYALPSLSLAHAFSWCCTIGIEKTIYSNKISPKSPFGRALAFFDPSFTIDENAPYTKYRKYIDTNIEDWEVIEIGAI